MKKKILSLMILSLFFIPLLVANNANANSVDSSNTFGLGYVTGEEGNGDAIVLGNKDPRTMVTQIINVLLTILGIVAVVIVLLGGFKWMTAGGNEDKVGEAKKILGAGVIGLVIILAAWGIAAFVLNTLMSATGN
jgi:heme/copper-type cytochrome/quinol oxidase subunit 2